MNPLERELRMLAAEVDWPAEPQLGGRVRARVERGRSPGFRLSLVAAATLVALALAIAFAVPPARGAILRFLGFGGVRIELVDRLPRAPVRNRLDLGPPTTLARARAAVGYRVLASALLGKPDEVHVRGDQVGFVYRRDGGVRLLVTQVPGSDQPVFAKKLLAGGTRLVETEVEGRPAWWITGRPHAFLYLDAQGQIEEQTLYLAGNTLLWQHGPLTLRLEGRVSLSEATRIASSFR